MVSIRCSTACLTGGSCLLAPTTALYFIRSIMAAPTCRLAASCPDEPLPVLGPSTVGSEGVEVRTACGRTVATTLGFLATLACWVAAGGAEELLLGAFTVRSERGEGTTAGGVGAATTPVTTAALVGLPCSSWMSLPPRATSCLLLMLTRSLNSAEEISS